MREKKHILLVEDDPVLGPLLLELLESAGHRGRLVSNGHAALHVLDEESYDLVVSDVCMPYMGGEPLLDEVRKRHPRLADSMIFITAEPAGAPSLEFLRSSGLRCLRKPFAITALLGLLDQPGVKSGTCDARL